MLHSPPPHNHVPSLHHSLVHRIVHSLHTHTPSRLRSRRANSRPAIVRSLRYDFRPRVLPPHQRRTFGDRALFQQILVGVRQRLQIGLQGFRQTRFHPGLFQESERFAVIPAGVLEIVFEVRGYDAFDGPSGNGVREIEHLDGVAVQYELLEDGRHEQSAGQGLEAGVVFADPIPGVNAGEVGVDVLPPFLQRRVDVLDLDGAGLKEQPEQDHPFPPPLPHLRRVLQNIRHGIPRVVQEGIRIAVEYRGYLVCHLHHRIGHQERFGIAMEEHRLSEGTVSTDEGTEGFEIEIVIPFLRCVRGRSRHGVRTSCRKTEEGVR
mmetsp:Transcript_26390/g.54060  ORF Transcript_26390/g.54060 Transcript_26390/m.54060 type:complete len:320 (-) Transcript_26390:709-1668(-)